MHIHASAGAQMTAIGQTQHTQQTMAARRAAAEVRKKLSGFAATEDSETVSRVDARAEADPDRRQKPQQDEESFRSVFFSVSA
jgi:hypothetical protein